MINNTNLVGRLTKTPELKRTNSGVAVTSFTLAVERNYTNAQGERETDFINCQAWRGTADIIGKLAIKGALVGITGNIQTRNYDNNQGKKVYVTEVIVDNFQMLEPKSVTDERRAQSGQGSYNSGQNNSYQGQQSNNQQQKKSQSRRRSNTNNSSFTSFDKNEDPFEANEDVKDIPEDDLPF